MCVFLPVFAFKILFSSGIDVSVIWGLFLLTAPSVFRYNVWGFNITVIQNIIIKFSGYSMQLKEGKNMRKCINVNFPRRGILNTAGGKLTMKNLLLSNLTFQDSISWGNVFNFMASLLWVHCKLKLSAPHGAKVSNRTGDTEVVLPCIASQGFAPLLSRILCAHLDHYLHGISC